MYAGRSHRILFTRGCTERDDCFTSNWQKTKSNAWHRHRITREDLRIHTAVNKIRGNDRPMTIAITAVKSNSNDKRSELLDDIVDIIKQPGKFNELITF